MATTKKEAPKRKTATAKTATKADVKAAVEQIFSVNVKAVNVVNVKG